jgi:hypothetical protein
VEAAAKEVTPTVAAVSHEGLAVIDVLAAEGAEADLKQARERLQAARQAESAAREKLRKAQDTLSQIEKPPYPEKIEPIMPR